LLGQGIELLSSSFGTFEVIVVLGFRQLLLERLDSLLVLASSARIQEGTARARTPTRQLQAMDFSVRLRQQKCQVL
jgi:hypothetical protein